MRDTDRDWQEISARHPYFGVLADQRFLNPDAYDLAAFFESGEHDMAATISRCRHVFGSFEPKSGLDFGCGVGRLVIPMAKICQVATGVDVAPEMLKLAARHAEEFGVNAHFTTEIPEDSTFDWVNSYIVLQHIPPARGYDIIRRLWGIVAPGGIMTIHVTAYKDGRHVGEINRDIQLFRYDGERVENYTAGSASSGGMSMYDYDLSRVMAILELAPGAPIYMTKTDHGGCHGFIIHAKKL